MLDVLFVGGDKNEIAPLDDLPINIDQVQNGMIALSALNTENYDSIILNDKLPMLAASRLISEIRKIDRYVPIYPMVTSDERKSDIFNDLSSGATFYIQPDILSPNDILEFILLGKQYYDFIAEMSQLDRQFFDHNGAGNIIGISEPMIDLYRLLYQIRKKDVTTILYGESGTGKNLVAKCLHKNSLRRENPFVSVNCPAIPGELLESELFGHTKGSFTGADSDKEGKFQAANSGTIFLDEIGDMDIGLQAKVLRVLESGEIEKVGSNKSIKVNVRIISATNQDLPSRVSGKKFREDLFHRINVFPITMPSLNERPGDIPFIAMHILNSLKKKHGLNLEYIDSKALNLMKSYHWPGNVRELENVLERASLTCTDQALGEQDISNVIDFEKGSQENPKDQDSLSQKEESTKPVDLSEENIISKDPVSDESMVNLKSLKEIEIEAINKTLKHTGYNMTKASKILGVSRMTLYRKVESYGLETDEQ